MANEIAKNNQNEIENDLRSMQLLQAMFGATPEQARGIVQQSKDPQTKAKIKNLSMVVLQKTTGMSMGKAMEFIAKYENTDMGTMMKAIKDIIPADRLAQAQARAIQMIN